MSGLMCRSISFGVNTLSRRGIHSSTVCAKRLMNDPMDHATGLEKQELLAIAAGNDDPFDMKLEKRSSGERDNPTLVSSACKSRLVGCICNEDSTTINWMWLTKGKDKRCECGYFFRLIDAKPLP